jgi:DNA-binding NarL/FixJ family response regulator
VSEPSQPCVLVVADPGRVSEIVDMLGEPLPQGTCEVLVSSGGDDTIDLFEERHPHVVVLTASLEVGDARSLIETLREMAPRAEVGIIIVGDDTGPIRTAIDAIDLAPDRFVNRPLAAKALRFAVSACFESSRLARNHPRTKTDQGIMGGAPPRRPSKDSIIPPPRTPTIPGTGNRDSRSALRARWEALADQIGEAQDTPVPDDDDDGIPDRPLPDDESAAPLPPPIEIRPRRDVDWHPGGTSELREDTPLPPMREPTLIIPERFTPPVVSEPAAPQMERAGFTPAREIDEPSARQSRPSDPPQNVVVLERGEEERWSEPMALRELADHRDSDGDLHDDLDDFDDDIVVGAAPPGTPPPLVIRSGELRLLDDLVEAAQPVEPKDDRGGGRDFARQLRAKMSQMAQRLFQNDSAPAPAVDVGPRHDHHTEIDLASLAEEPPLRASVTEIATDGVEMPTSPGSWNTYVRERGLPEEGEIVRGVSDAASVLAKVFMQSLTGRVGFRKGDVEKVIFFDQGRPVFASSNEPGDRMGQLLVREGKITAAQYERCQTHVAQSGRRMGEILVDFGYLKRRELLPAVRRHVEDIIYSLFGWDRGHYHITHDDAASAERIRLSRHPASLILEGIRRKLDRTTLEQLLGPASTVIEVTDRERVPTIINTADLATEERSALAAFDGQADLAQIARTVGSDLADVMPLAWGLVVLGLATARRTEIEVEESTALVGETDLAIDRERVRARWQLVTEADYFALLGVRRDATGFEIRRAYQAARRDFAADCFPSDLRRELARELEDIASVLDEAFRVLRDDRLRQTYLSNLIE